MPKSTQVPVASALQFLESPARLRAAAAAILGGAAAGIVLLGATPRPFAVLILALPLLVPVAVAKTATACGTNAVATLANVGRPTSWRLTAVIAYSATATLVAAALGLLVSEAGTLIGLPVAAPLLIPFCLYVGLWDLAVVRRRPPIASGWQVPQRWVHNRIAAPYVWGLFLGSGLATQMPYPSFYGLLATVAILPVPYGIALMALYGFIRSVPAVMSAAVGPFGGTRDLAILMRLRLIGHATSGLGCLFLAGGLAPLLLVK